MALRCDALPVLLCLCCHACGRRHLTRDNRTSWLFFFSVFVSLSCIMTTPSPAHRPSSGLTF